MLMNRLDAVGVGDDGMQERREVGTARGGEGGREAERG